MRNGGRRRGIWIGAALLLALILWIGAGIRRSCRDPVVNSWTVPVEHLDAPVRAVVMSDLHNRDFGEENGVLAEKTAAVKPDLILLDGDMVNEDAPDAGVVTALVRRLRKIAPVYVAWGNHELGYLENGTSPLRRELEEAGAVVLDKQWVDLTVNGAAMRLGGLYDYAFAQDDFNTCDPEKMDPAVYGFLTACQDTDRCRVMLSHRPDSCLFGEAASVWKVDLVISGHNHGGQVVLPFLGGVFGGDQGLFPEYVHGICEKDGLTMAITSGLGSQRELLPRFRNPPEIMVLDMVPKN